MEEEIWKSVLGFEGLYEASNYGRIRSLGKGQIIADRPKNKNSKYRRISLHKDGKRYDFFTHRLVWEAFNGPIPKGLQINHIDENPENNRLDNLNLMTPKENSNYGAHPQKISEVQKGINNSFYGKHHTKKTKEKISEKLAKPVYQFTKTMILITEYKSISDAEKKTHIKASNISNVCNFHKNNKTAGGYIWRFVS